MIQINKVYGNYLGQQMNKKNKSIYVGLYKSTGKPSPDPEHPDYLPTVFRHRASDSSSSRKIQRVDRSLCEGTSDGEPCDWL